MKISFFVFSRHSLAATFLRKLKAKELTTKDSAKSRER